MAKLTSKPVEPRLSDGDYTLSDGRAWFTVGPFSIRIYSDRRGAELRIFPLGRENGPPLAGCVAFADELTCAKVIDLNEYRALRRG